ncbi:MAG TPA: branched-chain amino acid transaminase [Gemmatimonadaceae bacterium]|nr:branched-chain amino acid transaminase [Gemmatimonadaceae bacterium]
MNDRTPGRTSKIWRDGQFVSWDDATIHVMSHVVHYGSSVFEGIRCYETPSGPGVFRLPEHIRRLFDSCRVYRVPLSHTPETLVQACLDTVAANDLRHCYLRPIVVRTGEQMGISPIDVPVETFIIAWKWGRYLGDDALQHGVDVRVSSWRRAAPDTFPALAKAGGNYLSSQLSKMEARLDRYAEGIMLDSFGYVSEGSGENLFVVRGGVVFTAPISAGILQGITRDSVMRIARDLGYDVREELMPREMLYIADEIFLTGTAAELTPVRSVDRIPVGTGKPGPTTLAIQAQLLGIANGRLEDRYGWLTMVPDAVPAAP